MIAPCCKLTRYNARQFTVHLGLTDDGRPTREARCPTLKREAWSLKPVYNVPAWFKQGDKLMSQVIPDKYRDLFTKRAFASLGTLMPDGSPQVTPVWCDIEGDLVIVNTAKGRQKDRNMRRDPRVALAIIDPDNPYRYLEIRGRIVEITENGAAEHIDKMAKKYLGADKYPYRQPNEVRVMYKIQPERTSMMG